MPASAVLGEKIEISIDGSPLVNIDDVVLISVRRGFDAASHTHIEFDTTYDTSAIAGKFVVGKTLAVKVGAFGSNALLPVFSGTILGVGCELDMDRTQMLVDAYDKSYVLGRQTKIKTHLEMNYADIVSSIASEVGLTATVSGLPTTRFESVQQFGTPHQFLDRITRASGCEWFVDDAKLVVRKRTTQGATVALMGGESLMSFSARYSASEEAKSLTVRGWDPVQQKAVVGTAAAPTPTVTAPIVTNNRKKVKLNPATAWTRAPVDQTDATAIATALHQWMDDTSITGRGQTYLNPAIVPGVMVDIDGMGPTWNGKYRVADVEHVFRRSTPFVTRFTVGGSEPTSLVDLLGPPALPSSHRFLGGVTIGVVTNLEDPKNQRRVKLRLPYLAEDEETGWARVVQLGAGNKRGLWIHPEVNDEVIVAFEQGDARLPVVIGGVWSSKNVSPDTATVKSGKLEGRSLTSNKGHLLHFEDGDKPFVEIMHASTKAHVRFDNDAGIVIEAPDQDLEFKNSKASIKIAKNGDITIKGNKITLDATTDIIFKSKDLKSDTKVHTTVTAGGEVKISGRLGGTLDGGLTTKIKGAMVNIN